MIGALLMAALVPQELAELRDYDLADRAHDVITRYLNGPMDERAPLVAVLEELYEELEQRLVSRDQPDPVLSEGMVMVCIALSEVDKDQLVDLVSMDFVQLSQAAAIDSGNPDLIAAAYGAEILNLRETARSAEAFVVLGEARSEIARLPSPPGGLSKEYDARLARAVSRLAGEEAELHRLVGRFDDALAAFAAADAAIVRAAGLMGLELELETSEPGPPAGDQQRREEELAQLLGLRARYMGRCFEIHLGLGLREPAREVLRAEEAAAERSGYAGLQATALQHRAHLNFYWGNFATAEKDCLSAAEKPWYSHLDSQTRALFDWIRAKSRDKREWVDPAVPREARDLLRQCVTSGDLRTIEQLYALCTLARSCLRTKELDAASGWLTAANAEFDAHPDGSDTLEFLMQRHWLRALEAEHALARGAPREELVDARTALEQATDDFLALWANVQVRSGGIGFLHHGRRSSSISALLEITLATSPEEERAERALDPLLRALGHGALVRSLAGVDGAPQAPPSLAAIRSELLAPGGGMLVYLVSEERSHVFAIDHETVVHDVGPPEHEIERMRVELSGLLSGPPPPGAREVGRIEKGLLDASKRLGESLVLDSIRARLAGWNEVAVCGLSTIGYLPFEVLTVGDGFLGDRMPLWYLASPSLGRELLRREGVRPARGEDDPVLLLLAAPGGEGMEAKGKVLLPWNDAVQEELADPYDHVLPCIGEEATYSRLVTALEERRPAAMHLVAHGIREGTVETRRGLLFSPAEDHDGRVGYEELLSLRAPSLAILSSCAAGEGHVRRGDDGIDDLGGALMRAGAAAVLLSVHDIHFDATMELMSAFHRRLAEGDTVARAAFEARRALAEHAEFSHPYFRSLVHVTGVGTLRLSR